MYKKRHTHQRTNAQTNNDQTTNQPIKQTNKDPNKQTDKSTINQLQVFTKGLTKNLTSDRGTLGVKEGHDGVKEGRFLSVLVKVEQVALGKETATHTHLHFSAATRICKARHSHLHWDPGGARSGGHDSWHSLTDRLILTPTNCSPECL